MSQILITRPLVDALPLAQTLKLRGLNPLIAPLFKAKFFPLPSLNNPQALIITSKNALRAIELAEDLKAFPLYSVGDQTTQLARQMGFKKAISASGSAQDLFELILTQADPKKGILYHLSGDVIKVDLVKELQLKGLQAKREIVYSIQAIENFPNFLLDSLQKQSISYVLFFSYKTAEKFVTLLVKNKLDQTSSFMIALCLSQDVARAIRPLKWKNVWVSPHPKLNSMIEYFDGEK
jgi:uroporphyrinogen-III synthase